MNKLQEYLISLKANISGVDDVTRGLSKIDKKIGTTVGDYDKLESKSLNVGQGFKKIAQIMDRQVAFSIDKNNQRLRKLTYTWKDFNGRMFKTQYTMRKVNNVWTAYNRSIKVTPVALQKSAVSMANFIKLASRAAMVIPLWFVMRRGFTAIMGVIGETIAAWGTFNDAMARVKTVVSASSNSVETDMIVIRRSILDMALKTRMPLSDLAEAFYYLRTANLSTAQAIAAFEPTVNLMVGTLNDAKSSARLVAGVYNTMGDSIGKNLTVQQKFIKIGDVLSYTYSNQDVQLSELTESYTKMAPYISGVSDSFTDVITTLGFLNTHMLRAGRTGRLTGRALLQITKNASKLAEIFNITFDFNKPLHFLGIVKKIANELHGRKITAGQMEALRQVFETRGAVPIALLVENFAKLQKALKLADKNAKGFNARMRAIRENTIPAQLQQMRNDLSVLFIDAVGGQQNFIDFLKKINAGLKDLDTTAIHFGDTWQYFLKVIAPKLAYWIGKLQDLGQLTGLAKGKPEAPYSGDNRTPEQFYIDQEAARKKLKENPPTPPVSPKTKEEVLKEFDAKNKKIAFDLTKKTNTELTRRVAILKVLGANELDIARYRLRQFKISKNLLLDEVKKVELQKLENDVIKARLQQENLLVNSYQKTSLQIAKLMGASELQILEIQRQQIKQNIRGLSTQQQQLALDKLRTKEALVLANAVNKQRSSMRSLYLQYAEAGPLERRRLRIAMKLVRMKDREIMKAYLSSRLDRSIIDKYYTHFTERINRFRADVAQKSFTLPTLPKEVKLPGITGRFKDFIVDVPTEFWVTWTTKYKEALRGFRKEFVDITSSFGLPVAPYPRNPGSTVGGSTKITANLTPVFNLNIQWKLLDDSLKTWSEKAGAELTEKLKSDIALQQFLAKALSPILVYNP